MATLDMTSRTQPNDVATVHYSRSYDSCTDDDCSPKALIGRIGQGLHGLASTRLFSSFQLFWIVLTILSCASQAKSLDPSGIREGGVSNSTAPLTNFEVTSPVYTPLDAACTQTLMVHTFANSYGQPFVGSYDPPDCTFNRVVFNFTVTTQGRQFDRLGLMYLGDTEVFRTSTAEPTPNGIVWTYIKDMSALLSLFQQPQKIIFDLPNIVDQTYTGPLNTTLTAIFFHENDTPEAADLIIPVSARNSNQDGPSAFSVPTDNATNAITIPRNVKKAFFTLSACGQATEEFWWSNVLSSTVETFPGVTLYGASPFRELQLLIDGSLAGVAWPFPVVFTGGIVPGFWRPIAGIDAFDLKEDEIDISPWLPLLTDGHPHEFTIRVVGLSDDGEGGASLSTTIGDFWIVTGKIFLWLDSETSITTGSMSIKDAPDPLLHVVASTTKDADGVNDTLSYSVFARRHLEFQSSIVTSTGQHNASWKQSINYSNAGKLTADGGTEVNSQTTSGADRSSSGYSRSYTYPLWVWNAFTDDRSSGGNLTIEGKIDRAKDIQVYGRGAFFSPIDALPPIQDTGSPHPSTSYALRNAQQANATFSENSSSNVTASMGQTSQQYELKGYSTPSSYGGQTVLDERGGTILYERNVLARNAKVIFDQVSGISSYENYTLAHNETSPDERLVTQGYPPVGRIEHMLGRSPPS